MHKKNNFVNLSFFFRYFIIVNMYIAVVLENYSQAMEDACEGITDEDYDIFYEIWSEFDPDGTRYIDYGSLPEFVDMLDPPLRIASPNKFALIRMDLPIGRYTDPRTQTVQHDKVYCQDILQALTRRVFKLEEEPYKVSAQWIYLNIPCLPPRPLPSTLSSQAMSKPPPPCRGRGRSAVLLWCRGLGGSIVRGRGKVQRS